MATKPNPTSERSQADVGIIMGSRSDWSVMSEAADILDKLGVRHEVRVVSAHRTPDRLFAYAKGARARGLKVIIAGAGGAAHLPGMASAMTTLPVLGVPVAATGLNGMDSLLSIVQMPGGVPVGTLAIGKPGAKNAGLLAAAILALGDRELAKRLDAFRARQTADVPEAPFDEDNGR
jgi:5-(carboxyamino)imidazole ribonucleotide mutase